jgi:hypothetical protein
VAIDDVNPPPAHKTVADSPALNTAIPLHVKETKYQKERRPILNEKRPIMKGKETYYDNIEGKNLI